MLKVRAHRYIRLATVEQSTAYVVVAVLFEQQGNESIALSEPRIVKIIPKKGYALNGTSSSGVVYISGPQKDFSYSKPSISPYTSFFNTKKSESIVWYSARPPTFV